jgi:hypothetical protein
MLMMCIYLKALKVYASEQVFKWVKKNWVRFGSTGGAWVDSVLGLRSASMAGL